MKPNTSNTVQQELRLIKWANDHYPPINFCNEGRAVIDLTKGYLNLKHEYDQLQEQAKVLLKDNTKLIDENEGLREDVKYLRELIREYSGKMLVNLSGGKVDDFLKEQITQPENDLIPGHHEKPGNKENIL